jgi:hypothetical protein
MAVRKERHIRKRKAVEDHEEFVDKEGANTELR